MGRLRRVREVLSGARSDLLDGVGLGLLAVAVFLVSVPGGFAAVGGVVLVLNWRMSEGGR